MLALREVFLLEVCFAIESDSQLSEKIDSYAYVMKFNPKLSSKKRQ